MGLMDKLGSWMSTADDSGMTGLDKLDLLSATLIDAGDPTGQSSQRGNLEKAFAGRRQDAQRKAAWSGLADMVSGPYEAKPGPQISTQPRPQQPGVGDVNLGPFVQGGGSGAEADGGQSTAAAAPPRRPLDYTYEPPKRGAPVGLDDPRFSAALMGAAQAGINVGPIMDLVKARSEGEYVNGVRTKKYGDGPAFIPNVDKGQEPVYNSRGDIVGVRNMDGSIQAAGDMAAAVEGGKQRASAPYEDVTVKGPGGQDITMSREAFANRSRGETFEGPTPAQSTYDADAAKAQVERDFTRPKAESALAAMDAKTGVVESAIERALSKVDGWSAGLGSMTAFVPGSPAKNLQAELETIKANLGFDELQTMRDNSPTGGALGQVAVQELEALRSTLSSLDQAQSPEQLRSSLQRIKEIRQGSAERRRQAFAQTYGGGGAARPQGQGQGAQRPAPTRGAGVRTQGAGFKIISVE